MQYKHKKRNEKEYTYDSKPMSSFDVSLSSVKVNACKQAKSYDKCRENDHKGDVGSQGTHKVNETHETHEDEEKGKGRIVAFGGETGCDRRGSRRCVGAIGVIEGLECGAKSEPKATKGHENDEREGIADYEFQEATDDHEETTDEKVGSAILKRCL